MNITVGRRTSGHSNWPGIGALFVGLTAAGVLAGVAVWQATDSDSKPTTSPSVAAARSVDFPAPSYPVPTYIYLVDSEAQASVIYEAEFEAEMNFAGNGVFNHNTRVIDLSTPKGQEDYALLKAELAEAQVEDPAYDSSLFRFIDMTGSGQASVGAAPSTTSSQAVPTYFYVVNSQEQADQVLQAEAMGEQEAWMAGVVPEPHHTEIIDVSTLAGQQLLNTINASLFEIMETPGADPSLIQVIDAQ